MIRRKIELTAVERERIVIAAATARVFCPVCQTASELLTTAQAAAFAQVKTQSVRRWLTRGQAHGVKTCGGRHRVCKNSLFRRDLALAEGA